MTQALEENRTATRPVVRAFDPTARHQRTSARMESDLRWLADGLLNMLETERSRIAEALNDRLVSAMTMARYLIEDAAQRLAHGELDQASEALQNASARLRDVAHQMASLGTELRPRILDDLGLLPTLAWYLRDFTEQHRAIFLSQRITVAEADVPNPLKVTVFRIVQAALSNVARHSKASAARVLLSFVDDELRVVIEDNGVGFSVERWLQRRSGHAGIGLAMILRWAESTGGCGSIESTARHGSRIQVLWHLRTAAPFLAPSETEPATAPAEGPGPCP